MAARDSRRTPFSHPGARLGAITIAFGLAAVALIGYGALVYTPARQREAQQDWQDQLGAMLDDRILAVDRWLAGRAADARTLADYPTLQYVLLPELPPPYPFPVEEGAREHLEDLFRRYAAEHGQRGIWVFDTVLSVRAGTGAGSAPALRVQRYAAELLRERELRPVLTADGETALFGVAIRDRGGRTAGVLVAEVPAGAFLAAVLDVHSLNARTAEALLAPAAGHFLAVAHDRARVRRLDPVQPGRAELAGAERPGVSRGDLVDRRGERVLVASAPVAGTGWRILTKVDRAEALGAVRSQLRELAALLAGLLIAVGGILIGLRAQYRASLLRARQVSDRRVRTLAENASDVIYRVALQPELRIEYVNRAIEAVTGYTPAELVADPSLVTRLVHPDDRYRLDEAVVAVPDSPVRLRWIHRDGHTLWLEQRATPVYDDAGRLIAIEGVGREITRQHEAETSLREAHERLQLALDVGGIGLYELDVPTMTGTLTAGYAARYGLSQGRAHVSEWQSAVHPEDRPRVAAMLADVIAHGPDMLEHEYRIRYADGTWHWVHTLARVTARDPSGRALRLLGVHADTTARRWAEEARRESEARHRTLFDTTTQGIVYRTAAGEIVAMNPAAEEIVGTSADPVTGRWPDDWRLRDENGDPVPEEEAPHRIALRGEPVQDVVLGLYNQRQGAYRWVLVNAYAHTPEGADAPTHVSTTLADLTPLRHAQAALQDAREMYRAVVENTHQVIARFDRDLRYTYINPACARYVPFTPAQLIGRTNAEIGFPEDLVLKWDGNIRAVFADGIPRADSYVLPGPGGLQHFDWQLFPEFDALGQVRTVVTVSTDVTETRLLEEQYQQAQKMEAVGRLAGGVAHDFNNLITAIRGYASFVHEDLPPGDRMRDDVAEILAAADRAAGLTRQLLAFSRKQVLKPEMLDLGTVLQRMEKLLRRLIGEDVLLQLDIATERGTALADAGQIEQVVMNLAVNARDAMPHGGTLTVSVRDRTLVAADPRFDPPAAPGDFIEVAVQDTGEGMPADTLAHLFEPFFTTKEQGKGTGLGLSTVYGIVRQSGGSIRVRSAPKQGTRFEILLPRTAPLPACAGVEGDAATQSGGETVLVVEDEPAVRSLTRRMLENAGYRVLVAESGQQALALAAREKGDIDLLLTDVVMPGLSGRDLARTFLRARPHTRILFMSGYTDDVIGVHGLLDPGVSLLQKPFAGDTLCTAVRATLDQAVALF